MQSLEDLLEKAQQSYEDNALDEAATLYARYLQEGGRSLNALRELQEVREWQYLAELRHRALGEPTNLSLQELLARSYFFHRRYDRCLHCCSELLRRNDLSLSSRLLTHRLRLKAACVSGASQHLTEDFGKVWQAEIPEVAQARIRVAVCGDLASVRHVALRPALEELADLPWLDDFLRKFLIAKSTELRQLSDLEQALSSRVPPTPEGDDAEALL